MWISFSGRLTAKIIEDYRQGKRLPLQYLSISAQLPERVVPLVGIDDLIILGSIYFALAQLRHRGFLIPLAGLLRALGVGLLIGGVYALAFIGGATITYLLLKAGVRSTTSTGKMDSGPSLKSKR